MEGINRKPFQGIANIIRFNWNFYVLGAAFIGLFVLAKPFVAAPIGMFASVIILFAILGICVSLAVSFYVYDCSNLYKLDWLNSLNINANGPLVNVHAGFDETSRLLSKKYPGTKLIVFDFYDPAKHTEISIKRARAAYGAYLHTTAVSTSAIPLKSHSVSCVFVVLAAHEIRNRQERIVFFKQLRDSLTDEGKIVVVEHLRDAPNFIAYYFGFLHFFSKKEWKYTFAAAGLRCAEEIKITPFISAFILQKNGSTS